MSTSDEAGDDLKEFRDQLDRLDGDLLNALAARQNLVADIIRRKAETGGDLRDTGREAELLGALVARGKELGLDGHFVTRLYHEIIEYSLRTQKRHLIDGGDSASGDPITVGHLGAEGAYSFFAAQAHFSGRAGGVLLRGFDSFGEVVENVEQGGVDYGVLPVENTTAGSINEAYDLLGDKSVFVVGEEIQEVDHCLLGLEDVPLSRIHRIYSHPQALGQCRDFLSMLENCHVESCTDTGGAARKIRDEQDLSQAAIASEEAGNLYGLKILKRKIADRRDNFTRFMILAAKPREFDERIPCKTSLILATDHQEGALLRALNVFAAHGLNLVKLESRPRPNVPWEYLFYVDFEGNQKDPNVREALGELTHDAVFIKVLGTYPARNLRDNEPVDVAIAAKPRPQAVSAEGDAPAAQPAASTSDQVRSELEKKAFKLASRLHQERDTVIRVQRVEIGGANFTVIAGPCSVESYDQVMETARVCRENGAHILRGGVFKPRTSPYSFQGLGMEGLEYLAEAGRTYDMPIVTEVMHPQDVAEVARLADILQIGARNMQNFSLLKAVGAVDRPVLLKRGMMASIDEWLSAAEYILSQGNQQVILCERGIRTFETATRNTFDISAVPVLREWTHLPVITDPAHAVGKWRWIAPLCFASVAAGAQGIMIEVHDHPEKALSDGPQALKYDTFAELMGQLSRHVESLNRGRSPSES